MGLLRKKKQIFCVLMLIDIQAEARDMLLVVYFDAGTRTSPAHAPVKLLRRVERLVSRAVRFLFALGLSTINKNLALVECYLNLQVTASILLIVC